jgi:hypothetical protein
MRAEIIRLLERNAAKTGRTIDLTAAKRHNALRQAQADRRAACAEQRAASAKYLASVASALSSEHTKK